MRKASLRSTLDLQKKRIIFKEINKDDKEVPIAMEYDKGHLNDYRLGSAHLRGYFLLTLPLGGFPRRSKTSILEYDQFMTDWALEKEILDEDSSNYEKFSASNNPSALAVYLAPNLQNGTKELETYLKFTICYWCMDDYIDEAISNASNLVTSENLQKLKDVIEAIFLSNTGYQNVENSSMKSEVPFFNSACVGLAEVAQELHDLVPNYQNHCANLVQSLKDWLSSISLFAGLMGKNWQSDMCYMTVRRENGQRVLFEMICLLEKVFLNDEIRKSLPCKLFYDAGDYITSLASDIFSLEKELASGEFSCNMILRKCVLKKMSLQMAIDICKDMVNDAVADMDQAGKDLLQVYPDDDCVKSFIREYQCYVDGSLFLYADHKKRYGPCQYSIKKVMYEDCLF